MGVDLIRFITRAHTMSTERLNQIFNIIWWLSCEAVQGNSEVCKGLDGSKTAQDFFRLIWAETLYKYLANETENYVNKMIWAIAA